MRHYNTGLMKLKCGTKDSVISQVDFALWGVAVDQPDWVGRCRSIVSEPLLKVPLVSALETKLW